MAACSNHHRHRQSKHAYKLANNHHQAQRTTVSPKIAHQAKQTQLRLDKREIERKNSCEYFSRAVCLVVLNIIEWCCSDGKVFSLSCDLWLGKANGSPTITAGHIWPWQIELLQWRTTAGTETQRISITFSRRLFAPVQPINQPRVLTLLRSGFEAISSYAPLEAACTNDDEW